MQVKRLASLALAGAVAIFAACSDEVLDPLALDYGPPLRVTETLTPECDLISFSGFLHGDAISSVSLFGGEVTLNVAAFRNFPAGVVNATALDTDRFADGEQFGDWWDDMQSQIRSFPRHHGGFSKGFSTPNTVGTLRVSKHHAVPPCQIDSGTYYRETLDARGGIRTRTPFPRRDFKE